MRTAGHFADRRLVCISAGAHACAAGFAAAPAFAGGGFPAIAATVPRAEEAASRRCWRQQGKRVCQKVEREEPVGSDPYYYFAPNTMPTARRGWKLDDLVNHPPPSPR